MIHFLLVAFLCVGCAARPEPPATEVTVPEPYSLSLPGVIPDDLYNQVRTRPALKKGLDGGVIPALTSDASPAERVKALHEARAAALTADKETQPQGPPKIPTAEDLAAGPIGPRPGDPMHRAFDRVCTDVLRTWFRSYAAWLSSRSEVSIEQRITELEALEGAAPDAIPWSPGDGESARIDVSLARAVMLEKQP